MNTSLNNEILGDRELDTVTGGLWQLIAIGVAVVVIMGSGTSNQQDHKGARPDGNGTRG
jgi:lactobin A/cerein 7B family class IIb bacteriocin